MFSPWNDYILILDDTSIKSVLPENKNVSAKDP